MINYKNNLKIICFQKPETFEDLPKIIWLDIMKQLSGQDINNLNLVSRKLHEIANLHPTKLQINISKMIQNNSEMGLA